MKLNHEQLSTSLKRELKPVYLLCGDEVLLVQEALDAVKTVGNAAGFTERVVLSVEAGFDWGLFNQAYQNTSLLSDKQCIELRLSSTKGNATKRNASNRNDIAKDILSACLEHPRTDKLLLIVTGKLDAALQKNTWYKIIEKIGVVVTIYPLQPQQVLSWITQRLQKMGLQADSEGTQLLAMATQGNLLATAREIEKLALLYASDDTTPRKLTAEHIRTAIADSARYDVFNLADAVLGADPSQVLRILQVLKAETMEPTLILWALLREIRQLIQLQQALAQGKTLSVVLNEQGVWEKRKSYVSQALRRLSLESLYVILQQAAHIDRVIKGAAIGNVWDELMKLSLALSS